MNNYDYFCYVGTYTSGGVITPEKKSEGIYVLGYNSSTGELEKLSSGHDKDNPSFLTISPNGKFLYSVGEIDDSRGGALSSYSINKSTGELTIINTIQSGSKGPCHVSTDKTGKLLLAANYAGGASTITSINEDGSLSSEIQVVQHQGSSIDPNRQMEPHAHSINVTPNNKFALVPDLGTDKVMIYKIDHDDNKLLPNDPSFGKTDPGMGPRHLEFHPNGKVLYVINEMGATITSFDFDQSSGELDPIQTISTVPDLEKMKSCADIHISSNGKFLYGSNRGHSNLAIFSVSEDGRNLTNSGYQSTLGETPRNFSIDPLGNYLLAANQDSGDIFTFKINQEDGTLEPTGAKIDIPYAVCIKFLKR
jgi:6-phosphogluconolactonase